MANEELTPPRHGFFFSDLDDEEVFKLVEDKFYTAKERKNFVVQFGPHHAQIAHDLTKHDFKELLRQDQSPQYPIRWINIWDPSDALNKESTAYIGAQYGFSKRLTDLMCLDRETIEKHRGKGKKPLQPGRPKSSRRSGDLEQGIGANGTIALRDMEEPASDNPNLELYLLVKSTVNYSDIDITNKALCIGAHWLHNRPNAQGDTQRRTLMPPRHWRWLALCNDNTVLSINEHPDYEIEKHEANVLQEKELESMRQNTLSVLTQVSKHGFNHFKQKPLSQAAIRYALQMSEEQIETGLPRQDSILNQDISRRGDLAHEGTSNLFYYLFEDYVAAKPLKESGKILEEMTEKVLDTLNRQRKSKPGDIIPKLHYLSKDLRELKHLVENYKNLIDKIIDIGKRDSGNKSSPDASSISLPQRPNHHRNASLTESALQRFDRLNNRLQWLVLNTIEGHLEEIQALSTTYFNLTQQKDSHATARLTRSATLLAKLSVFFLPISFMTSYFSIQIEDLWKWWNAGTYWYSFAVIASISFLSLFFFSRLLMFFSDVMDDWSEAISNFCREFVNKFGAGIKADDDD